MDVGRPLRDEKAEDQELHMERTSKQTFDPSGHEVLSGGKADAALFAPWRLFGRHG